MAQLRHSQGLVPTPDCFSMEPSRLGSRRRLRSETGASLVEYALLLGLVAVVAVGSLLFLGHNTTNSINETGNGFITTTVTGNGNGNGHGTGNGGQDNGNGNGGLDNGNGHG